MNTVVTFQSQKYPAKTIVEEMSFEQDCKDRKIEKNDFLM